MSFDQWIQIAMALGSWAAAFGTILAAGVALWLARRSEKVLLKAYVRFDHLVGDSPPAATCCLVIRVTNKGARAVTINSTGWCLGKSDRFYTQKLLPSSPDQFGKKLEYGETATFMLEESSVAEWSGQTLRQLANHLVEDGFSDESLKKLRAQIRTSLGHTENVVPSEQVLRELRTAMQQVSASTMRS